MTEFPIPIAIVGSTKQTKKCAQALTKSNQFELKWALTPQPKQSGREKKTKPNPFLQWSQTETDHSFLVNNKIDQTLKSKIQKLNQTKPIEILLVVDFGYIIPDWLLKLPTTASVNIHPSDLPRWRGSSPGQLVLLAGDQKSAVTLIKLNNKLDQGPIIGKIPFEVGNTWNHQEYYDYSFKLMADRLPKMLMEFIKNPKQITPQPKTSPTPIARKITKDDAFVPWDLVASFLSQKQRANYQIKTQLTQVLQLFPEKSLLKDRLKIKAREIWPDIIERASRAFSPWPLLWTKLPTRKGNRRMQILSCELNFNHQAKDKNKKKLLKLNEVRIAGQSQAQWNQVKNILS